MGPRESVLLHKYLEIAYTALQASHSSSTLVDAGSKCLDVVEKQPRSIRQSPGGFTALRLRGSGYASVAGTEVIMGRRCAGRTSDGNADDGRAIQVGGPDGERRAQRRAKVEAAHKSACGALCNVIHDDGEVNLVASVERH